MDEFNALSKETSSFGYAKKIVATEMTIDFAYEIVQLEYIKTRFHSKTVVLRIKNEEDEMRSYFLPEFYANFFRERFPRPDDFVAYKIYLIFKGFKDNEKKQSPEFKLDYQGSRQLDY